MLRSSMFSLGFPIAFLSLSTHVAGHASIFTKAMWGLNVTQTTFPYDNRPVAPLINLTFDKWWFHGHLDYPPNDGEIFELPAGKDVTLEIGCDKSVTSFRDPSRTEPLTDYPCPGAPLAEFHTTGFDDLKGCSLAVAYKSNVLDVQPEDFTVFSVNDTCVWTRNTNFSVPKRMPPCPSGGCICSWFWIHSADSGSEQNYMTGFRCNITESTSNVPLATPKVPRRCGADPDLGKPDAVPSNCTYGAMQPFYWFQAERNNMFEGEHAPPYYNELYNFLPGPQDNIFVDSVLPTFNDTNTTNSGSPTPSRMVTIKSTSTTSMSTTSSEASLPTDAPVPLQVNNDLAYTTMDVRTISRISRIMPTPIAK